MRIDGDPIGGNWTVLPGDGTRIYLYHNAGEYDPTDYLPRGGSYTTRIETIAQQPGTNTPQQWVEIAYEENDVDHLDRILSITDSVDNNTIPRVQFTYTSAGVSIDVPKYAANENVDPTSKSTYYLNLSAMLARGTENEPEKEHTPNALDEIVVPELDDTNGEKYTFDYGAYPRFGYLEGWTLPTGATVSYLYHHYASNPEKQPYHSEVYARTLQLDPAGPEYSWVYTRFGEDIARTVDEAFDNALGAGFSQTNPHTVYLVDPFDNLTVYSFSATALCPAGNSNCEWDCLADGCMSNWDDGLLVAVRTYAGPDKITSRLVRTETYEHTYDGYFQYKEGIVETYNRIGVAVRQTESTVTMHGVTEPSYTRRSVDTDWANRNPDGSVNLTLPPLARTHREYNGPAVYCVTYTDYDPNDNYHANHSYVELRNGSGQVLSRTDKQFDYNRLKCQVRRLEGTSPSGWTCADPQLQAGDIATHSVYDEASGDLEEQETTDGTTTYKTAYTYKSGTLESKTYLDSSGGSIGWFAVDRDIDANTGLVIQSRDPAGVSTTYSWDALGRLTSIDPASSERATTIDYVDVHQTRVVQSIASPDDEIESLYFYDNLGRVVEERRRNLYSDPSPEYDYRLSEYDIASRLVRQSEWTRDPQDPDLPWTTYEYRIFEEPVEEGVCRWVNGGGSHLPCTTDSDCPPGECTAPVSGVQCRFDEECQAIHGASLCGDRQYTPGYCTGTAIHCTSDGDCSGYQGSVCDLNVEGPDDPETCDIEEAVVLTDPLGRVSRVNRADGGVTETSYNGLDTTVIVYKAIVGPTTLYSISTYTNDPLGRLVAVAAAAGANATYTYDEFDNLREVLLVDPDLPGGEPASQLRRFTYDSFGRLLSATNPENGTVEYLAYDPRGKLLQYRDAAGHEFLSTYDLAGRLLKQELSQGTGSPLLLVENRYDTYDGGEDLDSNLTASGPSGKLTVQKSYQVEWDVTPAQVTNLVSTRRLFYGPTATATACRVTGADTAFEGYIGLNGRLAWESMKIEPWGEELQTEYCYDPTGKLKVQRYPAIAGSGSQRTDLVNVYLNGYLWEVHDVGRGPEYIKDVQYDAHGAPTAVTRGNNVSLEIQRDPYGRPLNFKLWGLSPQYQDYGDPHDLADDVFACGNNWGGYVDFDSCEIDPPGPEDQLTEWETGLYSYDLAGNITGIGSDSFQYDDLDRLVDANVAGSNLSYSYDAFGNMTSRVRTQGLTTHSRSFQVDRATNRLIKLNSLLGQTASESDYQYDPNGSMVSSDFTGYVRDERNRLIEVWRSDLGELKAKYDYDASGYRVHSIADGKESFYFRDGSGQLLAEYRRPQGVDDDPVWNQEYVYALGHAVTLLQNEAPEVPKRPWIDGVNPFAKTVHLTWESIDDPDFYEWGIERVVDGDPAQEVILWLGTGNIGYTDSYADVPSAGDHYVTYRIAARDTALNESEKSAPILVRPYDTTAPTAPTGLTAVVSDQTVQLLWDENTQDDDVWGYQVERWDDPTWDTLNSGEVLVDPGFTDFDLNNGDEYRYRVRAIDTRGDVSPPSDEVSATPEDNVPPAIPTGVRAIPGEFEGEIRITWDAVLDPDLDSYVVHNLTDDTHTDVEDLTFLDGGLAVGTIFQYRVASKDTSGNVSAESALVSATTRNSSITVPQNPTGTFEVDDNGTPDTGGVCYGTALLDDALRYRVEWDGAGTGPVFRVYRASAGSADFSMVYETSDPAGADGVCDGSLYCTYLDYDVSGDFDYYIVAVDSSGIESEATATASVAAAFDPAVTVTHVAAYDGRHLFANDYFANSMSRRVDISWSPVHVGGLQGYHVYRKCEWHECEASNWDNLRKFNCSHSWQRLTSVPVTGQLMFTDFTTGSMGGCFNYTVRGVGPNGEETDISRIIKTSLWDVDGNDEYTCLPDGTCYQPTGLPNPQCSTDYQTWIWEEDSQGYVTINEDSTSADEIPRVNTIAKGEGSPDGVPAAPILFDRNGAEDNRAIRGTPDSPRRTQYAWIEWDQNNELDLAGYHIEMAGSTEGPWKKITLAPVAWWETRFDVKGLWVESYEWDLWIGPECVVLRVIAVDDDGNESVPSEPQQIPEGCSASVPTAGIPSALTATTGNLTPWNACSTLLEWDRVPGAEKYYVYRSIVTFPWTPYFYRTHTHLDADCDPVSGKCQYDDPGDYDNGSNDPETDCPLVNSIWNSPFSDCQTLLLDAFYVTAVGDPGSGLAGESPPSKIAFWNCWDGYVRLEPQSPATEGLAQVTPGLALPVDQQVCSVVGGILPTGERSMGPETVIAGVRREALTAPLLTLGQSAPDPAYAVYDLHWDHLGSTRVVTNATGQVYSFHDFYPFGEEIQNFHDYNRKLFTGHERDEETGLDYMFARYYGSNLGRFLSVDPVVKYRANKLIPQRWNKYVYALNNPLKFVDPNGEDLIIVYDFSNSGLSSQQQNAVIHGVRQRFLNAGVESVTSQHKGSSTIPKKSELGPKDKVVEVAVTSKDLNKNKVVLGKTGGDKATVSTHDTPAGEAGTTQLINTTAHEVGHGTGALPQYGADAAEPGSMLHSQPAEEGSVMETNVSPEELGEGEREFSEGDSKQLRDNLNHDK